MDDLLERLRARAADPEQRTDMPRSTVSGSTSAMATFDLGTLFGGGIEGLGSALRGVVASNQSGRPLDPEVMAGVVSTYHHHRLDPPMAPSGQTWPDRLVPVIGYGLGCDAVDATDGRVIAWDPESLTERSGGPGWKRTFREISPSVAVWLETWVESRSPADVERERTAAAMQEHARVSREYIAGLTPAEREAMGLPADGWASVVWGGIGLDDDPERTS